MTKLEAAARQALEALENTGIEGTGDIHDAAVIALREALAEQAEQEPVAWFKHGPYEEGEELVCVFTDPHDDGCYSPLGFIEYAAPQPVQEDHDGHWSDCSVHNEPAYPNGPCDCGGYPPKHWRCACGANLYIDSNGAPASKAEQAEQEPIYISESCAERGCACHYSVEVDGEPVAVYSAPVRTKDLTDDELLSELKLLDASTARLPTGFKLFARAVIAADRKLNGVEK